MSKQVQVKNFKIIFVKKPEKLRQEFQIEVRATTKEDAIEKAYSIIGSKHRAPRQLLKIKSIKEISADELRNPILRELATNDKVRI